VFEIQDQGRANVPNFVGVGQVYTDNGLPASGSGGSNNTLRVRSGGVLSTRTDFNNGVPQGVITVGNNVNLPLGNTLQLAGGTINAHILNLHTNGVFAVEIQEDGKAGACVLAGAANFAGDSILRPSAVPGAPAGEWLVLVAAGGINGDENIKFQPPVPGGGVWSWRVDGNELRVKFSRPGTILMLK